MAIQTSSEKLRDKLPDFYRSIDIRTVAVRSELGWLNGVTTIRWSPDEKSRTESLLKGIRESHPRVESADIRLLMSARNFSEWDLMLEVLEKGQIVVEGEEVVTVPTADVRNKLGLIGRTHWILEKDDPDWPGLEISWERATNVPPYNSVLGQLWNPHLNVELSRTGFSTAWEVIDTFLQFSRSSAQHSIALYLRAPVPALVESIELDPKGHLQAHLRFHDRLPGLLCHIAVQHAPNNTGLKTKKLVPSVIRGTSSQGEIVQAVAEASVSDLQIGEYVEARVSTAVGETDASSKPVTELLPRASLNPLFQALRFFRTEEEIGNDLIRPQARSLAKNRQLAQQADYYEQTVQWILTCLGFQTIALGEFEKLREPQTPVELGSIDILAFDANSRMMFLVACTMGVPKEDDFTRLLNLQHFFEERVFTESGISVKPVVFTASKFQPCWQPRGSEEDGNLFAIIPVVDVERSRKLFSLIRSHNEGQLLSFLLNPMMVGLD